MLIYRICKNIENKMLPLYEPTIILTDSYRVTYIGLSDYNASGVQHSEMLQLPPLPGSLCEEGD